MSRAAAGRFIYSEMLESRSPAPRCSDRAVPKAGPKWGVSAQRRVDERG